MTERFVEANGIRLQCVQWRSPRRPRGMRCPDPVSRAHRPGGRRESLLPEVAERTRAGLRDALLVEIPDCSHFPFLERPREFAALLRGFLP